MPDVDRQVASLRALALLFGYVKYFHPSDEASAVDWDAFAVHGARSVMRAESTAQLRRILEVLFAPIAPTVGFAGDRAGLPEWSETAGGAGVGAELVAWQHIGHGLCSEGIYLSKRLHRTRHRLQRDSAGFGTVVQAVDAVPHRGRAVRLRAQVRAALTGAASRAQLWLRVDREDGDPAFLDTMADRPITASEWGCYEIVGEIAQDAEQIVFGCVLTGAGAAWVDSVELAVRDGSTWRAVPIENPGFENCALCGWNAPSPGYCVALDEVDPAAGARALRLEAETESVEGPLFAAHPEPGEVVDAELDVDLFGRVPLTLWSREGRTVGSGPRARVAQLAAELEDLPRPFAVDQVAVRLAAVIVAWNVFQHFYPYFDLVQVDWRDVLDRSLRSALRADDLADMERTLALLVEPLADGHAFVVHPALRQQRQGLPWRLEQVEGKIAVTAFAGSAIQSGDAITQLDGIPAAEQLAQIEQTVSGSPQWKRVRALELLGRGARNTVAEVLIDRCGDRMAVAVARSNVPAPFESRYAPVGEVAAGVWYVDMRRASMQLLVEQLEAIAEASGVVFDLRGYPMGNHCVLSFLLAEPDRSAGWMQVPHIIYPDRERIAQWARSGWELPVATPRIRGHAVFVTDARAISYAESILGLVEHYGLGEIVGAPTAGANGNVNRFTTPGGFVITWTGMRVVKHDGTPQHRVGIQPTVPAQRTLAGLRAGRDEVLERAIRLASRG